MKKIFFLTLSFFTFTNILLCPPSRTRRFLHRELLSLPVDDGSLEKQLHQAIEKKNSKQVIHLLNKGADPNKRNHQEQGNTPLHMAAQRNLPHIVAILLSHPDILIYKINNKNQTVLHAAAKGDSDVSIEYLLEYEITVINNDNLIFEIDFCNNNALHTTALHSSYKAAHALLKHTTLLRHDKNKFNKKPIDYVDDENQDMKKLLKNYQSITFP